MPPATCAALRHHRTVSEGPNCGSFETDAADGLDPSQSVVLRCLSWPHGGATTIRPLDHWADGHDRRY